MNPAMVERVMKTDSNGTMINNVHKPFITLRIVSGSSRWSRNQ